ncbi:MAG: hypothetical protein AAFO79_00170 [Pseudomonadota bacterium]
MTRSAIDPFAALEDEVAREVDLVFAERMELRPMELRVNVTATPHPSKPTVEFFAIFDERAGDISFAGGRGGRLNAGATSGMPKLSVELSQFGSGGAPAKHDRIARERTGDVYEIIDVRPDGMGRAELRLNHKGFEVAD